MLLLCVSLDIGLGASLDIGSRASLDIGSGASLDIGSGVYRNTILVWWHVPHKEQMTHFIFIYYITVLWIILLYIQQNILRNLN